jgi:hypothetical protein
VLLQVQRTLSCISAFTSSFRVQVVMLASWRTNRSLNDI